MSIGLDSVGLTPVGLPPYSGGGQTAVDCAVATLTLNGNQATVNGITEVNCSAAALAFAGLAATILNGTIALTSPVAYQTIQRNGSNQADIAITGTYAGSPSAIEASFNGGAYSTIVASPSGGTFSGTLTAQSMGQGTLSVRFTNDTTVTASAQYVAVGDIYLVLGQSNNVGKASSYVAPSTVNFRATEFGLNNEWSELLETADNPFSDNTDAVYTPHQVLGAAGLGSYFGALATKIMAAGVPVAFVPCSVGSTDIASWQPNATPTHPATYFGAALTRANLIGDFKAMLWYQGEADALTGMARGTYESYLNTIINTWFTETGTKTVVYVINSANAGTADNNAAIRAALEYVGSSNSHAIPGPRMNGLWTGNVHYTTTNDINAVAAAVFNVLGAHYYGGTVATSGVATVTATGNQADINSVTVSATAAVWEISGLPASIGVVTEVIAGVANTAVSGLSAQVGTSTNIDAAVATFTCAGLAGQIGIGVSVEATVAILGAAGLSCTIEVGGTISCGVAAFACSGLSAEIDQTEVVVYTRAPSGSGYSVRGKRRSNRPPNIQGYSDDY